MGCDGSIRILDIRGDVRFVHVRQLGIDPSVISHPANCRLILQSNNSSKKNKNDISLSQLIKLIEIWDLKYKRG